MTGGNEIGTPRSHETIDNPRGNLRRRAFLVGLGALGLATACDSNFTFREDPAVFDLGPYLVGHAVLGITPDTSALPLPNSVRPSRTVTTCRSGDPITISPSSPLLVSVYYPAASTSNSVAQPINIHFGDKQKFPYRDRVQFPLMLYAHARRLPVCPEALPEGAARELLDISQDFRRVETVLRHVASHGCVVMAPDLSGLTFSANPFEERAAVIVALYQHLKTLPVNVLARLNLDSVILAGHSTGGGAALRARGNLLGAGGPTPVAVGVLAPAVSSGGMPSGEAVSLSAAVSPAALLVIKGLIDRQVGSDPDTVYQAAKSPKGLVSIPGANHFGYTDICSRDNNACAAEDSSGTIKLLSQQVTAGGFLAALMRAYAWGDLLSLPYLRGHTPNTNLFAVPGVKVDSVGL
jgi:chlorophyllase-like protein